MTQIAGDPRLVGFVAVNAPFHLYGLLGYHGCLQCHVCVAAMAFHFCRSVFTMIEEDEVRYFVHTARWNRAVHHTGMTNLTLRQSREAGHVARQ